MPKLLEDLFADESGHATPRERPGTETTAAGFFSRGELLELRLRFAEATLHELEQRFECGEHPEWPTYFD